MNRNNLIFSPVDRGICLFDDLDSNRLAEPIVIDREEPTQDEPQALK